jgi:hypothetical protein
MLTVAYYAIASLVMLGVLFILLNVAAWTLEAWRD